MEASTAEVHVLAHSIRAFLKSKPKELDLFNYLFKNSLEEPLPPEEQLRRLSVKAVYEALNSGRSFVQAKSDGLAGTFYKRASALRDELDIFSGSSVGLSHPIKCTFPQASIRDGSYRLHIDTSQLALCRFWRPYLDNTERTPDVAQRWLALYTENVFFRPIAENGQVGRYFIRHADINDERADVRKDSRLDFLQQDKEAATFKGARHFIGAGDVRFLLGLCQWFERRNIATQFRPSWEWAFPDNPHQYDVAWEPFRGHNLILTGNPRTFPFTGLYQAQEQFPYQVRAEGTVRIDSADLNPNDSDLIQSRHIVRGVISRTFIEDYDVWVTAVLANHPRFMEAVLEFLTTEEQMEKALESWFEGVSAKGHPPDRFALHLEARVDINPHKKYDLRKVDETP